MAKYGPAWMQSGTYPAQSDRMIVAGAMGGMAVDPTASVTGMAPSVIPGTMTVQFTAGRAVVPVGNGDLGAYLCTSDGVETVDSPPSPQVGNSRYDLYVVQVRDSTVDVGFTEDDWTFLVVPGAESPAPTPPTPANAPTGSAPVAYCLVPANVTALTPTNLVDMRQQPFSFINDTDRTTRLPAPVPGMISYRKDVAQLEVWDGGHWQPTKLGLSTLTQQGIINLPNSKGGSGGSQRVNFPHPFAATPLVMVSFGSGTTSGAYNDWWTGGSANLSASGFTAVYHLNAPSSATATYCRLTWMAIGRLL